MQATLRISTLLLATFAMALMPEAFAKPGNGNGNGGGKDEPAPSASCADMPSAFPAFAFARLNTRGGARKSTTSIEFHISNADGDCSVLMHTAYIDVNDVDVSYRQIEGSGLLAWSQARDETQPVRSSAHEHRVIRVLRFQTADKEVVSIDPVETVFNSGDPNIYINSMDLAPDGRSVVFIHSDAVVYGTYQQSIREIEIANCLSDCSSNVLYRPSSGERFSSVSYGAFGDRIYFSGGFNVDSTDPRHLQDAISFIQFDGADWIGPRLLTIEGNGFYSQDFSGSVTLWQVDAGLVDLGNGYPVEAVAYRYKDVSADNLRSVHVIDARFCAVQGAGDCLGSGESILLLTIDDAIFPSVGGESLYFSSSSTDDLYRFAFAAGSLSLVGTGFESDTGAD